MSLTEGTHVDLDVPAAARRDVARALLGAAQGLGVEAAEVAATSEGFRVPAAVLAASGLEVAQAPPGLVDLLAGLGDRARAATAEQVEDPPDGGPQGQSAKPSRARAKNSKAGSLDAIP